MSSIAFLQANPAWFAALAAIFGLAVGSFLNVVIYRLPQMMRADWLGQCAELRGEEAPQQPVLSLLRPRSRCPGCDHPIAAHHNIPLLSYGLLRGRCANCRKPISLRYPAVELAGGLLAAACAWRFGFTPQAGLAMLFAWSMVVLALIDYDTMYLPDDITLPLLWLGVLANLVGWGFTDLKSSVIGAAAGYLFLWSVYWSFKLVTGKEGMGYGDFKLLAATGAWFGWSIIPAAVLLSAVVGAVIGITLIASGLHQRSKPMPFGPYLAGAAVVTLFFGAKLTHLYFGDFFA